MPLDRRSFLGAAAAMPVAGGALNSTLGGAAFAGTDAFDMSSLDAHVKMRCDLKGKRTFWYYRGTIFGKPEGELTRPMLHVEGVSQSLLETLPDGKYRYSLTEAGYYADPETGKVKDRVLNPFTKDYYKPKHYLSSQRNIFAPDLSVKPDMEELPPNMEFIGEITPVQVFRDTVWSTEDLYVRMPNRPREDGKDQPEHTVLTSLATLVADRRAVLDPGMDFVECQLHYQTLASWRHWMNMGTIPGVISWRMIGTKLNSPAALPADIKTKIASDHKDFFVS